MKNSIPSADLLTRCGLRGSASSTRSGRCLALFLLFGAIGPISGIVPYLTIPGLTVAFFNGEPSDSANFWCSLTASADLTISFLCFSALFSTSIAIKQLAIRTFFVYAVTHFGIFWVWSFIGNPLAWYWHVMFATAISMSLVALLLWGVPHPTKRNQRQIWPIAPVVDRDSLNPLIDD
jgi:hypothetical protein